MPGLDIRRDDTVKVMSGKSRGHTGRVIRVDPTRGRVMVEGAAIAKKHTRSTGRRSTSGSQLQQGGIIDTELFIEASNVQIVCRSCGKPTRVGHVLRADGSKARVCRKCEGEL